MESNESLWELNEHHHPPPHARNFGVRNLCERCENGMRKLHAVSQPALIPGQATDASMHSWLYHSRAPTGIQAIRSLTISIPGSLSNLSAQLLVSENHAIGVNENYPPLFVVCETHANGMRTVCEKSANL